MNILRNSVLVVLGSFIVACSTSAGGDPTEAKGASESAETSPAASKDDAKKSDAKSDAKKDDKATVAIPGLPGAAQAGEDGADGTDGLPGVDGADLPADGADGTNMQAGGGHSASNNDCCFNGDYFECPDTAACFGGFDVNACIAACGNDFNCSIDCTSKLSSSGPPKGCTQKAPPANVQCK